MDISGIFISNQNNKKGIPLVKYYLYVICATSNHSYFDPTIKHVSIKVLYVYPKAMNIGLKWNFR